MIELEPHRRYLRAICYRMTGSAADADDLVQQTFARAIESPPSGEVRPWLSKVAMNLSRDLLRARKTRGYTGPWLPSPIAADEVSEAMIGHEPTSSARYDLLESVSFAFLLALEVLTPAQRAVLILRDVFDYSVAETAEALDLTESNVKTTHHRARAALEPYDLAAPVRERSTSQEALATFLGAIASQDVKAVENMLRDDVRALSDGGGKYHAALNELVGRARVMKFFLGVANLRGPVKNAELRMLNGVPALYAEYEVRHPKESPRAVVLCDVDSAGRISTIYSVLADDKLTHVKAG